MDSSAKIISRGMRWSPEMAQAALDGFYYIKVGDKTSQLQITGAPNRWKKEECGGDIYIPSVRIAGAPMTIRTVLENNGYDSHQVEQLMGSSYTRTNYNVPSSNGGMKEQYDQECFEYLNYKKENSSKAVSVKEPLVKLQHLEVLVSNLPQSETSKATRKAPSVSEGKGGFRGAKVSLKERLETLPAGKVLDVSGMNEVGSGVKMIDTPGPQSKKRGVLGLPIVSKSLEKYTEAMQKLGPEYLGNIEKYKQNTPISPPVKAAAKPAAVSLKAPAVKALPKATAEKVVAEKVVAPISLKPVATPVSKAPNLKTVPRLPAIGSPKKG